VRETEGVTTTAGHVDAYLPSLGPLVVITLLNYVAQVPYYLHNDYSSMHPLPGLRAIVLLGATLAWFLVGLTAYRRQRVWGYWVLLSYLLVEAVFYLETLASGMFIQQLRNHTLLIDAVFVIGYIAGLVATYYAYRLIRFRRVGKSLR
jgi:hypothetical protein